MLLGRQTDPALLGQPAAPLSSAIVISNPDKLILTFKDHLPPDTLTTSLPELPYRY